MAGRGRPRLFAYMGQAPPQVVAAAEAFLGRRLAERGIGLAGTGAGGEATYALLLPDGRTPIVKLLARAGPHRRGGGNNLGLHWMLKSDVEEYVALVDVSRQEGWLLPAAEYRARAQPLPGGRFHLDWLALRLSARSKVPDEEEFEAFRFESAIPQLLNTLTQTLSLQGEGKGEGEKEESP